MDTALFHENELHSRIVFANSRWGEIISGKERRMTSLNQNRVNFLFACAVLGSLTFAGCATGQPGSFFSFAKPKKSQTTAEPEASFAEATPPSSQERTTPPQLAQGSGARDVPASIRPTNRYQSNSQPAGMTNTRQTAPAVATAPSTSRAPAAAQLASATARRSTPVMHTLGAKESFQRVVQQAPGVVLVDFYADWCGPCKTQGKILHEMESTAAQHQATILKVNVDEHPELQEQFQVAALPTLLVLKDGKLLRRQKGLVRDKNTLQAWMAE